MHRWWLGMASAALAAGCSSGGSGNSSGGAMTLHCNYAAESQCATVTAPSMTTAQQTALQGECTGDGGTPGTGACPTTNAVAGACAVTNAAYQPTTAVAGLAVALTFYSPTFNATSAAAACTPMGTWSGGSSGGGTITSARCAYASAGRCLNFVAASITSPQQDGLQAECTADGGAYGTSLCATANAVAGTCVVTNASVLPTTSIPGLVVSEIFYTPTFDTTTAASACAAHGAWTGVGGSTGGIETVVSCGATGVFCTEFRANPLPAAYVATVQAGCSGVGTYAAAACPSANAVAGYCRDTGTALGVTVEQRDYYYSPAFTVQTAQAECTSPATWIP